MDSFEELVKGLLEVDGYWVKSSVKVNLTREEKVAIGRPASPRWEIDLVAYKGSTNEILVVECKSYLDSGGVGFDSLFLGPADPKSRYKLFREDTLRDIVFSRLTTQLVAEGTVRPEPTIRLCLAAAKILSLEDHEYIQNRFDVLKWRLFDPVWIRSKLEQAAQGAYEDNIASVVAKILLRAPPTPNERRREKLATLLALQGTGPA